MAINKNSNGFTFGFAIGMVVIVGAILAITAMALKEPQTENVKREKMQNILTAIQVEVSRDEAPAQFEKYVKERITISHDGKVLNTKTGAINATDKQDPFNVDVKKEFKGISDASARNYPYFVCEKDGETFYVIPMVGNGLWGPIWGYVSLKDDYNTIFGASFDHKTETPGLGAEIREGWFSGNFIEKQILDENGNYVSVDVVKGGAPQGDIHGVDAITGGTITSDGVGEMVDRTLKVYSDYFTKNK